MTSSRCWLFISYLAGVTLAQPSRIAAGECYDSYPPTCPQPCPCLDSCYRDEDCAPGQICVPEPDFCVPSFCLCNSNTLEWGMTLDCTDRCIVPPMPEGPPTYTIVELGPGRANAINNLGQIVGTANFAGLGGDHSSLWENGQVINLTPSFGSSAIDVNNAGQVLINADRGQASGAYVWEAGSLRELPRIYQHGAVHANAINDVGEIVGESALIGGATHGVLWEQGIITDLTIKLGVYSPRDINLAGHVLGSIWSGTDYVGGMWAAGEFKAIGTLGGARSSASQLTDTDQIIGWSQRASGCKDRSFPFLWESGEMLDLLRETSLEAAYSSFTINNCGQVLLIGDPPSRGTDFYLFEGRQILRPIRGVTRPTAAWRELTPLGLNDRGQIVGWGKLYGVLGSRAFVMSPIAGDLDGEGHVDLKDFAEFQNRFTGSREPNIPGCEKADLDADADVDVTDMELFRAAMAGPS